MKINILGARQRFMLAGAMVALIANCSLAQVDSDVTEKTKILYNNLKKIQNGDSFLFGQEFFNSFRYSSGAAHSEKEYSDSKAVTGAHPAVLGSDFHYYLEKSPDERNSHTEAVKWAYQQGYVITFDWHISGRGTTTYEYQAATANLANNIVNDLNGDRAWFYGELDKVIDIINNDLVVNGERIPIVFRPLHEMNGGWFWWGSRAMTADNYKKFYRLLVDYVKERTTTVLFCWSPNGPTNSNEPSLFNLFPGNEYVDVLGVDIYEVTAATLRTQLGLIVDYAQANDKVAVFSETGNRTNNGTSPGDNASLYWKNTVLPAILNDPTGKSKKIAWVLTWINASWSFPYVPHAASSQTAKQSFIDFKNSPNVLFGDEISNMYTPLPADEEPEVPVSNEQEVKRPDRLNFFFKAQAQTMMLRLNGFKPLTWISVYDLKGMMMLDFSTEEKEIELSFTGMQTGMYLVKVSDGEKVAVSKVVVTEQH